MKVTAKELKELQELPLDIKIKMSLDRIQEWYEAWNGQVYVAWSKGKDSTALLDLVRSLYPEVPAIFCDTGLEYPEIRKFGRDIPNTYTVRPVMPFHQVIKKWGYPVISKEQAHYLRDVQNPTPNNWITRRRRLTGISGKGIQMKSGMISKKWLYLKDAPFKISDSCCDILKKRPMKKYSRESGRKDIVGTMAQDSSLRKQAYMRTGCNNFTKNVSTPIAAWLEADVWAYIRMRNLPYSKIYDMGESRTGCIFCMFGVHLEPEPNRFQRMKLTHPKLWRYCIDKLGIGAVMDYIEVPYE